MTNQNDITIIMQDVDVVRTLNPAFAEQLTIAAVSRVRTERTERIETEALDKKSKAEK